MKETNHEFPGDNPPLKLVENAVWMAHIANLEYEDSTEYAFVIYKLAVWFDEQDFEAWSGEKGETRGVVMDYYTAIDMVGMVGLGLLFGNEELREALGIADEAMWRVFPYNTFPIRVVEGEARLALAEARGVPVEDLP